MSSKTSAALEAAADRQNPEPASLEDPVVNTVAYRYWKRALDVTIALPALVIALPVIGVAAILIKTTFPGPVFYAWDNRWSLGLDLRILFNTIFVVLHGTGA